MTVTCDICGTPYERRMISQRYCSRACYQRSWATHHPEEHRERSRRHRAENPKWHQEREPKYYQAYRTKEIATKPWLYLLKSRKSHAKLRGLTFNLTNEWASARWTGRCEITGLEFVKNVAKGPHPFSPSLDRIEADIGYTQNNSRFILWGCNAIKGVGTDSDMYEIAAAITASHKG